MEKEKIFEEVREIFRNVFDDNCLAIDETTNAEDIEDWDSLEQINLLISNGLKFN